MVSASFSRDFRRRRERPDGGQYARYAGPDHRRVHQAVTALGTNANTLLLRRGNSAASGKLSNGPRNANYLQTLTFPQLEEESTIQPFTSAVVSFLNRLDCPTRSSTR